MAVGKHPAELFFGKVEVDLLEHGGVVDQNLPGGAVGLLQEHDAGHTLQGFDGFVVPEIGGRRDEIVVHHAAVVEIMLDGGREFALGLGGEVLQMQVGEIVGGHRVRPPLIK